MTDYNNGLFFYYGPFWKKCCLEWRLALRKPLDPSCLSLLSLPLFSLSALLTGAPLDTYHFYCCFYTFQTNGGLQQQLVFLLQPFLEKVLSRVEACIEETIGSILFKSIQSSLCLSCIFMYCVDDCILLPLFDTSLLMDHNDSPLQVINP